jgi:hypothetical protein
MKRNLLAVMLLASFGITFTACKKTKEEENNNGGNNNNNNVPCTLQPTVTTNSPVAENGKLELHVNNVPDSITNFYWTGPNGFTSTEKNPVIDNVRTVQSGKYTVKVTRDTGCHATAISDSVAVTYTGPACSPATNTGVLTGYGTLTATAVTTKTTDSSFVLSGTASGGKVEFTFGGAAKPKTGLYRVQPLGGSFVSGDVRIKITAVIYTFTTSSGYVYVGTAEDKLSATFCDLTFTSPSVAGAPTASGNLTEP